MVLRLILTRHAKSSWDDLRQSDHDRPLNKRGRASAQAVGDWMRDQSVAPQTILCSTAARTRETLALLALDAPVNFEAGLYHCSADAMLAKLAQQTAQTVLMVGHNPSIAELAERLAHELPRHPRFLDYPTCATTVMEFDALSWQDVQYGAGTIKAFVVPRELSART